MSDIREFSFLDWLKLFLRAAPAFVAVCAIVVIPVILAISFLVRDKDGQIVGEVRVPSGGEIQLMLTPEPRPTSTR